MRAWTAVAASALLLAGCISPASVEGPEAALLPQAVRFGSPVELEQGGPDRNPTLALAPDGAWYACTSMGAGAGSNMWRSLDGGASFEYLGTPITPDGWPVLRSGTGDVGGGGCDVAVDRGGRVYLVDLWAGSSSASSSSDQGSTWRGTPLSQLFPNMDRPWALGGEPDELFVTGAQVHRNPEHTVYEQLGPVGGIWVVRSTDGGLTFPQQVLVVGNEHRIGLNGNLAEGPDGTLYVVYSLKVGEGRLAMVVAKSEDRGLTWSHHVVAEQNFYPGQCLSPINLFPAVAADEAGGVYAAWALNNPDTSRLDVFLAGSPDEAETWFPPVMLADGPGTRVKPWLTAGLAGRVGVVWYETNATMRLADGDDPSGVVRLFCEYVGEDVEDAEWHLRYAFTANGATSEPAFVQALVHPGVVRRGVVDAEFAEVIQVEFDAAGRAAVAYMADDAEGSRRAYFAQQEELPGTPGAAEPASPDDAARPGPSGEIREPWDRMFHRAILGADVLTVITPITSG